MNIKQTLDFLNSTLPHEVTLVAVSKTYPPQDILQAYDAGQRVFGESRPQEMKAKYDELPKDIRWHMIGHLQTNKVKYIAPFVELIHSVDSPKLLEVINKEALKNDRTIDVLLEVHIAQEESKHGFSPAELLHDLDSGALSFLSNVRVRGLMGIATFTDDTAQVRGEMTGLKKLYDTVKTEHFGKEFDTLSMGMTTDYKIAVECGSTMVRIGSMIFGERNYNN